MTAKQETERQKDRNRKIESERTEIQKDRDTERMPVTACSCLLLLISPKPPAYRMVLPILDGSSSFLVFSRRALADTGKSTLYELLPNLTVKISQQVGVRHPSVGL